MDKELHIWFNDFYPAVTIHVYGAAIDAVKAKTPIVHTTQISLARTKFIEDGYRLFIHPYVGGMFEITLGNCDRTAREIRPCMNLEKMLLNGEFAQIAGEITGEE